MDRDRGVSSRLQSFLVGSLATLLAAPVFADQSTLDGGLDEVVVTARKREERLQDVSLSITAIPATEIEKLGVSDIDDVARLDASLIYDKGYSATDNRISIRGLSPTRGRVNVAVLVDGIDTSSESIAFGGGSLLATNRLLDLAAVEVVKGPQSALYGRSAFAGAIQYVTKDPSAEAEGNVRGEFGDFGRYNVSASLSGPITDTWGLRFNAVYWSQDGIYRNEVTGAKVGDGDGWGAALSGKWQPGEDLSAKFRLEFTDDHFGQFPTAQPPVNEIAARPITGSQCLTIGTGAPVAAMMGVCPTGSARVYAPTSPFGVFPGSNHVYSFRGTVPGADELAVRLDPNPLTGRDYAGSDRQINRFSLVLNWNLGPGTLTSLTGYTDAEFTFDEDGDFDSGVIAGVDRSLRAARFDYSNRTRQISQELRYRTDFDGALNFMLGALYWNEDADQVARSINILCVPALPAGVFGNFAPIPASCGSFGPNQVLGQMTAIPRANGREIDHRSAFAMLEWGLTERWKLTLEGRYSDEDEKVLGVNCAEPALPGNTLFPGQPPLPCNDSTLNGFQVFGPSVNLLYPYFDTLQFFVPGFPALPGMGVRQGAGAPVELESNHSFFTPRVTLEVKPSEDTLVYLTAAKGVKPGGISTVTAGSWQDADYDGAYDEFTFRNEKLTEYELGAKTEWLNGRLRVNPSLFSVDYKDKQVGAQLVTPSGIPVGRLLNAGKAEVKGLELDAQWAINDNWFLAVNYSYLDAKFTDFPFTSTSATDAVRFGSCPRRFDSVSNARVCHINLKGNRLERAPEHSIVGLARWSVPIGDRLGGRNMRFFIEGDVQAQGERYIDIFNNNKLDDFVLGNLRFGVTSERWDALVYIDNVGEDDTVLTANSNPGDVAESLLDPTSFSPADTVGATLPDPRIIGLRFTYRFAGN
jgi:outer membrane receptor protein involved in Fe transport